MSKTWSAVRWAFAAVFVSLAVLIPVADLKVDEAAAMAALLVLALVVAALSPSASRTFGPRVQSLKVGGLLEIGLFEAKQAAGREGDEDPVDSEAADDDGESPAPDSLLTLRLKLEAKLTYIAKYMLGTPDHPTFLTVGSLEHDGFLSDLEARTATRVLSWRDEDLAQLSPAQAVGFLADADKVVRNMRAGVLQGMVRRDLKAQGWRVKDKRRGAGRRPDLIASRDGSRYRIAAVFVMASESDILERAKNRLAKRVEKDSDIRKHIVVVPDRSKSSTDDDSTEDLRVVKLQNLAAAMVE